MKKVIAIILGCLMLLLVSCESLEDKAMRVMKEQFKTFDLAFDGEYDGIHVCILTDRDTDVQYIIVQTHQGIGITKK